MSQNYDDSKQPKSIRYHSTEWAEVMQMFVGLNDADQGFDHFFLMCENFMRFMPQVIEAIKQKAIETKIELDQDAIEKLNYIWEGPLWLEVKRAGILAENVTARILHYGKRPEQQNDIDEIIQLPALQNMNPVSGVKENVILVRIREAVPVKYAFDSLDYKQVVLAGGMFYNYKFSQEPLFHSDEEIMNSEAYTMVVGRPYFHNVVNIEKKAFVKYFNIIYINFHRIINEKLASFDFENEDSDSEYISEVEE